MYLLVIFSFPLIRKKFLMNVTLIGQISHFPFTFCRSWGLCRDRAGKIEKSSGWEEGWSAAGRVLRDWFHKQMPTIESWHVARWIALFESQITRRAYLLPHLAYPSYRRIYRPLLHLALASPLRPSRRRLRLRGRLCLSGQSGNLPHAYAAATLSLSLSLVHPRHIVPNFASTTTKSVGNEKYHEFD